MNTRTVIIPAGNLWTHLALEYFSHSVIKVAERQGPLLKVTNPWYLFYRKEAANYLRIALLGGELTAYYCDDDGVKAISRGYWRRDVSAVSLRDGEISFGSDQSEFVFVENESFQEFCDLYEAGDWPYGPKSNVKKQVHESSYTTPFITMMMGAIKHFEIPTKSLKKAELVEFFLSQTLPDGSPVSRNHAEAMATFCRPLEAMKGGNKRVGS